jgi:hypothetical protein
LANSDDQGVTFLSGSVEQVNPTSGNFELDVDAQSTFDSFIGIEKWDEFQDSYEKEHAPATQTTFEFSSAVFEVVYKCLVDGVAPKLSLQICPPSRT